MSRLANEAGEEIHDLTRAFELFTQKTSRLEKAYGLLKRRFASVNLELEETNHYLKNILEHMTQGLVFVGADGKVKTFNGAAEQILGLSHDDVLEKKFDDVFPAAPLGFSVDQAIASGTVPEWSSVTLDRPQGICHLEVTATLVHSTNGEGQGVLLLLRDTTELQNWKRIADRNDRMKELGEMAASVAHEIRNPLGGIKGFAALLVRDLDSVPDSRRMAQQIVDGAEDLNRLVTNILHYSRPLALELRKIDLSTFIDEVVLLVEMDSQMAKGVTIEKKLSERPFYLTVDRDALKGALLNLLINAAQAMPNGGTTTVALERNDGEVTLTVSDQGIGIPEEQLEKIFSPFFTTKHEGNGFGLSEVYRVAQGHGGTVEVASEVGLGTKFTLTFPSAG